MSPFDYKATPSILAPALKSREVKTAKALKKASATRNMSASLNWPKRVQQQPGKGAFKSC